MTVPPPFATTPPSGLPDLIEHDACALAAFATRDGKPSRRMVEIALTSLQMMVHRSGSVDGEGDGSGLLIDGAVQQAALQGGANLTHRSDPRFDTADFSDSAPGNLRADYVLPRKNLQLVDAGVFWPLTTDPLFRLVGTFPFPTSDHRAVWIDVTIPSFK